MDLDALEVLKGKWAEQDRKLDVSIRLNRQVLLAAKLNRARTPLRRFAFLTGLGAIFGLAGAGALGEFIYRHWTEPRFALPAAILDVWIVATVAAACMQFALALRIDYSGPVAGIQRQLESLRALRTRIVQWAVLTGQLVWWMPFLVVALKQFFDVDAYKVFGGAYLAVNFGLGLAIIPLAIWASRRFSGRMAGSPLIERLMRDLAGYNLNTAAASLSALSEFES